MSTRHTIGVFVSIALGGLLAQGCSGSSRKTYVSTAAGVTSSTTAPTTSNTQPATQPGPLAQKAQAFEAVMGAWHLGLGQVQDVRLDANGAPQRTGNHPSRCLWTGFYAASQARRFRQTGDPNALDRMEQSLQALHDMHEITGLPGVVARGFDEPSIETNGWQGQGRLSMYNHNKGTTSRDQYAGWFYGIGMAWDLIQDPILKSDIQNDVRAVADKLMAGNLKMETAWGPQGKVETFFSLDPRYFYQDQINAQTWATVDDFPFNLITKSVPYDQQLADAIKNAQVPPVRAGEALRAVFFFTVAEKVTGDIRYGDYKRQLLHQRQFLQIVEDYTTITDDLLHGRNSVVARRALTELFTALGDILSAYLAATGQGRIVTQFLVPIVAGSLSTWLSQVLVDALNWLHNPSSASTIQQVVGQARIAVLLLNLIGQNGLAQQIDSFLNNYGQNLSHQGLIDLARTIRSHLGTNLTLMPLALCIQLEQDPAVVARYKGILEKNWDYLQGDHNAMVNLMHAGYGHAAGPNDVAHAIEELQKYPVDMAMREVDNSNWPGLVLSPWPDRFGRVGNHALVPDYFPIDHKAPDIFPWRKHPRQIKSGSNSPNVRVAPLGYLQAYWLARDLGILTAAD